MGAKTVGILILNPLIANVNKPITRVLITTAVISHVLVYAGGVVVE